MKTLLLCLMLILVSCAHNQSEQKVKIGSDMSIADSLIARQYDNIYFSGQPSQADVKKLKAQGFTHIVNLRQAKEYDETKEQKQAEELGFKYSHFPLNPKNDLTVNQVREVTQAVVKHRSQGKTLIHCSSGNRAAYWAGAHFYLDHKYSKGKAMEMAKRLGLKKSELETKLAEFMSKN